MVGRFTARRVAAPPKRRAVGEPAPRRSKACPGPCFPELSAEPAPPDQPAANPLLSDKLLDAKVRLHRRLIEEINLSALEKLPEDEMRGSMSSSWSRNTSWSSGSRSTRRSSTTSSPKSSTR